MARRAPHGLLRWATAALRLSCVGAQTCPGTAALRHVAHRVTPPRVQLAAPTARLAELTRQPSLPHRATLVTLDARVRRKRPLLTVPKSVTRGTTSSDTHPTPTPVVVLVQSGYSPAEARRRQRRWTSRLRRCAGAAVTHVCVLDRHQTRSYRRAIDDVTRATTQAAAVVSSGVDALSATLYYGACTVYLAECCGVSLPALANVLVVDGTTWCSVYSVHRYLEAREHAVESVFAPDSYHPLTCVRCNSNARLVALLPHVFVFRTALADAGAAAQAARVLSSVLHRGAAWHEIDVVCVLHAAQRDADLGLPRPTRQETQLTVDHAATTAAKKARVPWASYVRECAASYHGRDASAFVPAVLYDACAKVTRAHTQGTTVFDEPPPTVQTNDVTPPEQTDVVATPVVQTDGVSPPTQSDVEPLPTQTHDISPAVHTEVIPPPTVQTDVEPPPPIQTDIAPPPVQTNDQPIAPVQTDAVPSAVATVRTAKPQVRRRRVRRASRTRRPKAIVVSRRARCVARAVLLPLLREGGHGSFALPAPADRTTPCSRRMRHAIRDVLTARGNVSDVVRRRLGSTEVDALRSGSRVYRRVRRVAPALRALLQLDKTTTTSCTDPAWMARLPRCATVVCVRERHTGEGGTAGPCRTRVEAAARKTDDLASAEAHTVASLVTALITAGVKTSATDPPLICIIYRDDLKTSGQCRAARERIAGLMQRYTDLAPVALFVLRMV